MRNDKLPALSWAAKLGCVKEQLVSVGSVVMPVTTQSWCTPPSRVPSALNLNRTSRIGPYCCSNVGTTFCLPKRRGTSRNSGFSGCIGVPCPGLGTMNPPEPPKVGWAWQMKHWSALWRAPRPLELVWNCGKIGSSSPRPTTGEPGVTSEQVSHVDSSCPARLIPSLKDASSLALMVAPVVG